MNEWFAQLRMILMEKLDFGKLVEDEEILEIIDDLIVEKSKEKYISLKDRSRLRQDLFYSVRKLDVLQELIDDSTITEIMVNGPFQIFFERDGRIQKWDKAFATKEKLEDVIQQIVGTCNRVVNEGAPIVDARLNNGARVNAVIAPVALNGPILTIRRFPDDPITMEKLIQMGSITRQAAEFLKILVISGYSIIIGGATSSGKTTFLNALSNYIPKDERIITIEDNAELQVQGVSNLVRLEAKSANMEGNNPVTIRDLIKTALRMRPNRIIVGEVRSEETLDLLQALNTGHEGSLSTAHANSNQDMISRLETMVLLGCVIPLDAIRRQIASGVDIMVHLGRQKDKSRKVLEIAEVEGYRNGEVNLRCIFQWREGFGLVKTGKLLHREKLEKEGYLIED